MEEQSKVSSKENIFSYFPRFEETDEGKHAIKENQSEFRKSKTGRVLSIILIVISLLFLLLSRQFIWGVILFACGVLGFLSQKNREQKANINYYNSVTSYTMDIANFLIEKKFVGSKGIASHDFGFIYNNDFCAYFSILNGNLIIYSKENIKEVQKERVLIGTTTTSVSSGKTRNTVGTTIGLNPMGTRKINFTTNANSVSNYEWHLDIFSNFMDYPRVSMVFKDSQQMENLISEAYAFLLP